MSASFAPRNDNYYAVTRRIDLRIEGAEPVVSSGGSTYVPDRIVGNITAGPNGIFHFKIVLFREEPGISIVEFESSGHKGETNTVLLAGRGGPLPEWLVEPMRTWVAETYAYQAGIFVPAPFIPAGA